ncbi:hypothetical protein SPB21_29925 [Leptothoe sp. ISB3NOV94-8A]
MGEELMKNTQCLYWQTDRVAQILKVWDSKYGTVAISTGDE